MRLHSLVYRAVSSAFALFSGLTLLVLLFMIPVLAGLPWLAVADRLRDLSLLAFFAVLALSIAFGAASALIPAISLARFALRIWPIDAFEIPRRRCIVWQRRLAYASAIAPVLVTAGFVLQRLIMEGVFDPGASPEERGYVFAIASASTAWGVTIATAAAISSWVHAHPGYFRRKPFILYLRRFSGFADRTVIAEVLKAAAPGIPVAFIASPQSAPRNWDPFVWAFSGLCLRHPLGSLPVQLRSSDEGWEKAIARLTSEAGAVVMDITERSASVDREISMVAQHAQPERVLYLLDRRSMPPSQPGNATPPQIAKNQTVGYTRHWAFPTLVMKTVFFAFVGYEIFLWVFGLPGLAKGQNEINLTLLFALITIVGLWLAGAAVLLLRPSIDTQARQALQRRLAQVDTSSHKTFEVIARSSIPPGKSEARLGDHHQ